MSYNSDLIELVDQRVAAAQERRIAAGTVSEVTSATRAMVVFDGSALAVPVKTAGHVVTRAGSRVTLVKFGSDWVITASFDTTAVVLLNTPDSGFPVNANATTTEVTSNRLTVPAAGYSRLLSIEAHTLAQYSQASSRIAARLYVGSTLLDTDQRTLPTQNVDESFKVSGQYVLPAGVDGIVEVRFARVSGTGAVTTSTASTTYLRVSHRPGLSG